MAEKYIDNSAGVPLVMRPPTDVMAFAPDDPNTAQYRLPPLGPPNIAIENGIIFAPRGFWPRIILGFAVGGALAWLIPSLIAR